MDARRWTIDQRQMGGDHYIANLSLWLRWAKNVDF